MNGDDSLEKRGDDFVGLICDLSILLASMDDTLSVGDTICLYSAESFGFIFSAQSR